jgi:hypothetical protein
MMKSGVLRGLWLGIDILALAATVFALMYIAFTFAARELALTGQVLVFLSIVMLSSVPLLMTRYHVLCGVIFIALLVSIDQIDQVKFAATLTRLHPSDWFVATHFMRDFDYSIAVQYHRQLRVLHWALGILAVAGPILWACERAAIRNIRPWRAPAGSFAAAIVATFMCFTALLHSQYLRALAGFHDADLQWAYNGLRISSVVLQVGQLTRMDREIKSLQAEARDFGLLLAPASARAATCGTAGCPDIVIVHLESVFDPVLLADYRATGGYLGQMEKKSSAASKSGLLRVHTWGGASWISEFAVLCGVDPTIFGLAGAQPHLNLSRYVKNCLPNYLKRLGYETHAVYTSYWNFVGVGAGFERYGIDDFIDIRRIKGAPTDWRLQRDKFFIDEARRILAQPSRQPRFIFVSTNWNHSPHGQGSHLETYPGPFDIGKASDGSTRDYVNRLNDTFTEMAKLERDLTASGKPIVMLFYGDHHPAFVKKYAPDLPADPYVRTDVLTFYRFARSYGPAGASPHATLWIEELPTRFLEFAGIPLPPAMATIRALREKCNNTDARCPAPLKIRIGAAILED